VQRQNAVVTAFPRSKAALAFKKLAQAADMWPVPQRARGNLEFFMDRLVHAKEQQVEAFL
jgi:flagellar biosynthesis protein FlhG